MNHQHLGVSLGLLFLAAASAQDAKPATPPDLAIPPKLYEIQVQPRIWYVSLAGDLSMPGAPANTPTATLNELNVDSPRAGPYGDATIRFDRWTVNISAAAMSAERSTTAQRNGQIGAYAFSIGDPIRTSVDFATGEASVGYSLGTWDLGRRGDGTGGFVVDLAVLGGARLYDVSVGIGATTPTTSKVDEFFIEPILGGRLEMNIAQQFSIDVQSTAGWMPADRESISWDIAVAFAWHPLKNLGLQIGYRNLWFDLSTGGSDKFELNGGAAGVFAGLQLRF